MGGLPMNQKPLVVVAVAAVAAAAVGAVYARNWAVCQSQSTLETFCNLPPLILISFQFHSALLLPSGLGTSSISHTVSCLI